MDKDFIIGLDVGTDSVGWAATDLDFNLLRLKGKTAWGSRLFDVANDAKERRVFRINRRRLARRRFRLACLQSLFSPFIVPMDPNFFLRLSESALHLEDKSSPSHLYPLFGDKEQEKAFYKKYPTIWHLRSALLKDDPDAFADIRYLYLAIHHIVKYRGNFLIPGEMRIGEFDYGIVDDINAFIADVQLEQDEEATVETFLTKESLAQILKCLSDNGTNATEKQKEIKSLVNGNASKEYAEFFAKLLTGKDYDISKLDEDGGEKQIVHFGKDYDEKEPEYQAALGDRFLFVEYAKIIFDHIELEKVLGKGNTSISEAFVATFEAHKKQLRELKNLVLDIDKKHPVSKREDSLYFRIFKDPKCPENYPAFIKVDTEGKRAKQEDFCKFILKTLERHAEEFGSDKRFIALTSLAKNQDLLTTIALKSTSLIPHQLHQNELTKILGNAKKHFPFIESIEEKILATFLYHLPYYYGPLSSASPYSNVVFKEGKERQALLPWTYKEAVDEGATKQKFMESLTNYCQYLVGEPVLPKQSILFMDYVILNRLNGMVINGSPISQEMKLDLFENLICKNKKTTLNKIKKYLLKQYPILKEDGISISGVNEEDDFVADTRAVLSSAFDIEKEKTSLERMIRLLAIYCDSKQDALAAIESEFPGLNAQQKTALKSLTVKGWASLSQALLEGTYVEGPYGEVHNIISLLKETTLTFNQVYFSSEYPFKAKIDAINKEHYGDKGTPEIIDDIIESLPPKMVRSTIQSLRIVEELVKVAGKEPKVIALEVTRTAPEKIKGDLTRSRKKQIEDFLSAMIKGHDGFSADAERLKEELAELDDIKRLKGKKLYLYFIQNGFDLYTGERIDINDILSDSGKYDIDHIFPQSKIKDDSLDNKVLVSKEANQRIKQDLYPIPESIRCKPEIVALWKKLHKMGQISDKKYNRLIRATELTEEELNDFVAAQLNVVSHSNKAIAEILKIKYPNTKIIYSKAQFPSYVRDKYGIYKLRDLNDTHHAVDAYLNIVTGTILHSVFSSLRVVKALSNQGKKVLTHNMLRVIDYHLDKNAGAWAKKIKANCERHDFLLTYRPSYADSAFYNTQMSPKKVGLAPAHEGLADTAKYGGYDSVAKEFMVLAIVKNKNGFSKFLMPVPHIWNSLYGTKELSEKLREDYLKANPKVLDVTIDLEHPIYNSQIIEVAGCRYLMTNSNINQVVLQPFDPVYLSKETVRYLKFFEKRVDELKSNSELDNVSYGLTEYDDDKFIASKATNISIMKEIVSIANKLKYKWFANGDKIRAFGDQDGEAYQSFFHASLGVQIETLFAMFTALTRTGTSKSSLLKSAFQKARSFVNQQPVMMVHCSVTGLYSSKKEL